MDWCPHQFYNAGTAALSKRGEKTTAADWGHNDAFVTGLVRYANDRLN